MFLSVKKWISHKMDFKRITFIILLFIFVVYSYLVLARNTRDIPIVKIEKKILVNDRVNTITFELASQDYFFKTKFLNKNSITCQVTFNDHILALQTRKSHSDITAIQSFIPKAIVKDVNTVKVIFLEGILPEEIVVRLRNFRVALSSDIYIFPKHFSFNPPIGIKELIYLAAAFILSLYLCRLLFVIFQPVSFLRLQLIVLFPFLTLVSSMLFVSIVSPYRIFIDKLYFIYFWIISFLAVSVILAVKYRKKIASEIIGRRKTKERVFIVLFNIVLFFVIFVLGEVLTRVYISRHYTKSPFRLEDIHLGSIYAPGFKGDLNNALVTTNSKGFRNRETGFDKPKGIYRIGCLGDSITFGFGLSDDASYVHQLEKLLNKTPNKTVSYETINFAMPAYETYQERLYLERNVLQYHLDLLIVQVTLNDLTCGINIPSIVNTLLGFDGYSFEDMSAREKLNYLSARHSYFYQYLVLKYRTLLRKYKWKQTEMVGAYSKKDIEMYKGERPARYESQFKEEILRINEITKINNIKLLVAVFPNDIQLSDKALQAPQKMIGEFCRTNGISCLDLLGIFSLHKNEDILIDIGHPSVYGNYLAAMEIADYLRERKILE